MIDYHLRLIKKHNADDKLAIEKLVSSYGKKIYNTAYYLLGDQHLALGIVDQVLVEMYSSAGNIAGESNLHSWVYELTIKHCMEKEEKKTSCRGRNAQDTKEILKLAIVQLPVEQRLSLILHDIQKLSYNEIAQILNVSLSTVSFHLHQGRLAIHEMLNLHKGYAKNAVGGEL